MQEYFVKEFDAPIADGAAVLDLTQTALKQCRGCWSCWWTTPGRCAFHDLDDFYRAFLAADKVYIYCGASQGFVTSNMKALIDRMIVLVLPNIAWDGGESRHEARYDRYPAVDVLYRGDFLPGEEEVFVAYWRRTLDMLYIPQISVRRYQEKEARV